MTFVNLYNNTITAMNSRLDVVLWDQNQSIAFDGLFAKMENIVIEVELMLSRYNTNAEVFQLNQQGKECPVHVSDKLFKCIEQSLVFSKKTNGYYNIGYEASGSSHLQLAEQLVLNREHKTLEFTSEEVVLDFGGIGKGIALKEIALLLEKEQVHNAFISFGGSSILTRGRHPYGDYWPLTLQDGRDTHFKLNNTALSISGFHEKGDGEHVINPKTGELKHKLKQVEVQITCPIEAEVLSTALLVAPEQEHTQIINAFKPEKCIRIPL